MNLPYFKYHPDPLKTGLVKNKTFQCICCDQEKNYLYVGPAHSLRADIEDKICVWCLANGSAAKKFDAEFAGELDNVTNINPLAMKEFAERTPGYICWQDPLWLTHCDDICEFHGDFSKQELLERFDGLKIYAIESLRCNEDQAREIISYYDPEGNINPAFYKFVSRKCNKILLHCDFT